MRKGQGVQFIHSKRESKWGSSVRLKRKLSQVHSSPHENEREAEDTLYSRTMGETSSFFIQAPIMQGTVNLIVPQRNKHPGLTFPTVTLCLFPAEVPVSLSSYSLLCPASHAFWIPNEITYVGHLSQAVLFQTSKAPCSHCQRVLCPVRLPRCPLQT